MVLIIIESLLIVLSGIYLVKSTKMANKVDEELNQSSEMLSIIFDLNPDAIVLTRVKDGKIVDCNQEYLNQIGYSRKEVIGNTTLDLNLYSSKVRQAYLEELKERDTVTNFELRVKRKDDVFIDVLYSARFITINGEKILLNIGKDITKRKNREKQIKYHALLLSKVNDAVIGTDANYNITYWNKGSQKMFGFTETEAIGKTSQKLLRPNYAPGEREKILEELNLKGSSEVIINTKHRNGTEIIVEANSTRIIDEYGNISGYVVVYHDITEQKQTEHKIQEHLENEQQLTEEFQTSNEELQAVTEELQVSNEELQQQRNELANVNNALLDSKRRMNISQEIAHLGGWELDIENDSLSWSDEVYRIFGLQPQEFDATYEAFLDNIHPDDRAAVDEAYSGSIREGRDTYEIEHRIIRKSTGEVRIVHEKCEHFRDSSNKIVRSIGMVHDITEQKQAEKALVESETRYHSLYSSMSEGVAIHEIIYNSNLEPVDYIITDVNNAYEEITGLKKKEIEGKKASEIYGTGNPPYIEIYSRVVENGKTIEFETYFEPMNKYFKISVISPGKGEFATIFEDITKRKLTDIQINEAKDNLEQTVQKRTEELNSANRYNRSLIEASLDPLVTIGPDGKITDVNHSTEFVTGYSRNELIDTDFSDYFTEPERAREGYQKVFHDGFVLDYPLEIKNKNGHITPVLYNASVYRDENDEIIGIFAAARDITERKKAEEEIQKLANIVESSDDAIISKNLDGIIMSWNRGAKILYGYSAGEVIGKNISILKPTTLKDEIKDLIEKIKNRQRVFHYETKRLRKDGEVIDVSLTLSPIFDTNKKLIGISTIARDITERKKVEEELEFAFKYNRSLIEASVDPLVTIGRDGKITDVNNSTESVTGYSREDLIGTDFSYYFTEPEKAREGYQQVYQNGTVLDYPLEIKHKNGHITPVLYNASVYKDDNDEIIGVFAAARDITKLKKAEKKLEFASKYNRSLIEASVDPLVTIGPEGKITDVNHSTEFVTGYSRNELIDTDFSDYFTEPERAREGYQKVFHDGFVLDYPLEIKNKNGHITSVLYNASVYKDEFGDVIGVFAAARDITEIKKFEKDLQEYQDTLEDRVEKRTEELAKSNKELEQFAYITSHDLREPLRMITSFLQLLERRYADKLDQDANDFIGFAVDGAKRLDAMTNDSFTIF